METIYEGYLVHYGRPRLFAPGDQDTILLLGDYLYAQGLVRLATAGSVEAVADMGELISLCAQLRAEGERRRAGLGRDASRCSGTAASRRATTRTPLVALANAAAGEEAVDRALAAHRQRVR